MDNFAANLKEVNDLIDNDPVFLGQLDKLIENSIDYWKDVCDDEKLKENQCEP